MVHIPARRLIALALSVALISAPALAQLPPQLPVATSVGSSDLITIWQSNKSKTAVPSLIVAGGGGATSFSGGSTGFSFNDVGGAVTMNGVANAISGGTGLSSTPTNGQIDIGNGTGFTRTTLTGGTDITVTNGSGSISVGLTNNATTVNGVSCVLGATCTITAAVALAPGTTTITGGTSGDIEYNNAGVLGEKAVTGTGSVVLATSPTIASPTVTSSFTATGLVTNADLVNQSTTVNGVTCTLGTTCTISASAGTITPGTTTVASGTSNGLLYDNAGVLGNLATANSGVLVTSSGGVPSVSTTLPSGLAMQTPASINLANATALSTTALTGTLQATQFPALTGDVTTTAGSVATTVSQVNGHAASTITAQGNTVTGSGSIVLATAPSITNANLNTPSAINLSNASSLSITAINGLGTGVATALGQAVTGSGGIVLATSPTIASPTTTGTLTGAAANWSGIDTVGGLFTASVGSLLHSVIVTDSSNGTNLTAGCTLGSTAFNQGCAYNSGGTLTLIGQQYSSPSGNIWDHGGSHLFGGVVENYTGALATGGGASGWTIAISGTTMTVTNPGSTGTGAFVVGGNLSNSTTVSGFAGGTYITALGTGTGGTGTYTVSTSQTVAATTGLYESSTGTNTGQEVTHVFNMIATGGGDGAIGSINNGKTAVASTIYNKAGSGNGWGEARTCNSDSGFTFSQFCFEHDQINNAYNSYAGNPNGIIANAWLTEGGAYPVLAYFYTTFSGSGTAGANYGWLAQNALYVSYLVDDATTGGVSTLYTSGTHTGPTLDLEDTAPIGLQLGAANSAEAISLLGTTPEAIKISGSYTFPLIDETGHAGTSTIGLALKAGDKISFNGTSNLLYYTASAITSDTAFQVNSTLGVTNKLTVSGGGASITNGTASTTALTVGGVAANILVDYLGAGTTYLQGTQLNISNFANSSTFATFNSTGANLYGTLGVTGTATLSSTLKVTGMGTGAGNDPVCFTTASGLLTYATGSCTVSDARKKHDWKPGNVLGIDAIMKLRPGSYYLNDDPHHIGEQVGLLAQDVAKVDPRLASYYYDGPDKGTPSGVRYEQFTAMLTMGEQDLQREVIELKAEVAKLKAANDNSVAYLTRKGANQ